MVLTGVRMSISGMFFVRVVMLLSAMLRVGHACPDIMSAPTHVNFAPPLVAVVSPVSDKGKRARTFFESTQPNLEPRPRPGLPCPRRLPGRAIWIERAAADRPRFVLSARMSVSSNEPT